METRNFTILLSTVILAGCSMFPTATTVSVNQKLENFTDKPTKMGDTTIKLQQDFKWQ